MSLIHRLVLGLVCAGLFLGCDTAATEDTEFDSTSLAQSQTGESPEKSSGQLCRCWPTGEKCDLPGVPYSDDPADESLRCPKGEWCDGDAKLSEHSRGRCRKLCDAPGASHSEPRQCHPEEECRIVEIEAGVADYVFAKPAMCMPIRTMGTDQTDNPIIEKE
ncbi:MAG TPA: hypothetical protein PK329_05855 [Myxococcota bacterium]|nr:hypothetical protein [Myxococcota bacterium]HOS61642.1 hypothetical protein [Myxococcota bacterium]HPC92486.1 hypothetical protein [Myxococcota bacterium]HQE73595.1 hypothetical protein [Myxococcota bacterium]HQI61573.1 hypothetical protein [Myxococcota bacterium]